MSRPQILLAQLLDDGNHNAQVSNAAHIVIGSDSQSAQWTAPYYESPDRRLADHPSIRWTRLVRGSLWRLHKSWYYQTPADVIFYPGPYWFDALGLMIRRWSGRRAPIVATLEGLVGDAQRERQLSSWAGHQVNCQHVDSRSLRRIDDMYQRADHIIAISPFLANMGARLYGDKFSVLPLGVNRAIFHRRAATEAIRRPRIIGAGRLYANKRPELFLGLAARFRNADFIWFGGGELLDALRRRQKTAGLDNLAFPGAAAPEQLAAAMRNATAFVLPSLSEGVPKVTQEAAASGLPVVIFGYYESPSVIDGETGYVVWDDEALFERVGALISDVALCQRLSDQAQRLACQWDWVDIAPRWVERVVETARLDAPAPTSQASIDSQSQHPPVTRESECN